MIKGSYPTLESPNWSTSSFWPPNQLQSCLFAKRLETHAGANRESGESDQHTEREDTTARPHSNLDYLYKS